MQILRRFWLFINSIYSYFKCCFFPIQFIVTIVLREGNFHFYFIPRMGTDQLILKIINVGSGTNGQIGSLSLRISTVKSLAINITDIINVYLVTVFYRQAGVCAVIRFRGTAGGFGGIRCRGFRGSAVCFGGTGQGSG